MIDRKSNAGTWKTVKGFWDGSCKDIGKSGCGVVIKRADRGRWLTISRIAVPLKVGTFMAAEMRGVCVLPGIQHLIFHRRLGVQNINGCVDNILLQQWCAWLLGVKRRNFQVADDPPPPFSSPPSLNTTLNLKPLLGVVRVFCGRRSTQKPGSTPERGPQQLWSERSESKKLHAVCGASVEQCIVISLQLDQNQAP